MKYFKQHHQSEDREEIKLTDAEQEFLMNLESDKFVADDSEITVRRFENEFVLHFRPLEIIN